MCESIFFFFGHILQSSGLTPPGSVLRAILSNLGGPYLVLRIEPRLVTCKTSALLTILLSQS